MLEELIGGYPTTKEEREKLFGPRDDATYERIRNAPLEQHGRLLRSLLNTSMEISARQKEILQLYSDGFQQKEIGIKLGISIQTVMSHLDRVRDYLDAKNTTHACCIALRKGLIE